MVRLEIRSFVDKPYVDRLVAANEIVLLATFALRIQFHCVGQTVVSSNWHQPSNRLHDIGVHYVHTPSVDRIHSSYSKYIVVHIVDSFHTRNTEATGRLEFAN